VSGSYNSVFPPYIYHFFSLIENLFSVFLQFLTKCWKIRRQTFIKCFEAFQKYETMKINKKKRAVKSFFSPLGKKSLDIFMGEKFSFCPWGHFMGWRWRITQFGKYLLFVFCVTSQQKVFNKVRHKISALRGFAK